MIELDKKQIDELKKLLQKNYSKKDYKGVTYKNCLGSVHSVIKELFEGLETITLPSKEIV